MKTNPAATGKTAAAIASRQQHASHLVERVRRVVERLQTDGVPTSIAEIARRAEVSRAFLYQNPNAAALVRDGLTAAADVRTHMRTVRAAQADNSWRERALNAEAGVKEAYREIETQRHVIGDLLGRIRDLEADLPEDGVQRVLTENGELRRRIRELEQQVVSQDERLRAARDNGRFLDRKISQLEAQLIDRAVNARDRMSHDHR